LTAMMMATNWAAFSNDLPANLIKGGTALSGIYDLTPIAMTFMHKTLSFTSDQISRNSPEFLSPITDAPLIISVGGDESNEFRRQSEALAKAWGKKKTEFLLMKLKGINHFTILGEYANPKSTLAQAIQKQMGLD
jgi:arylformamidase